MARLDEIADQIAADEWHRLACERAAAAGLTWRPEKFTRLVGYDLEAWKARQDRDHAHAVRSIAAPEFGAYRQVWLDKLSGKLQKALVARAAGEVPETDAYAVSRPRRVKPKWSKQEKAELAALKAANAEIYGTAKAKKRQATASRRLQKKLAAVVKTPMPQPVETVFRDSLF